MHAETHNILQFLLKLLSHPGILDCQCFPSKALRELCLTLHRFRQRCGCDCSISAAGGEQERRFQVQSDALQPCCFFLPPQIDLISIDCEEGGEVLISLSSSTCKACLKNFLSPQITSTISHLTVYQPRLFSCGDGLLRSIWSQLYSESVWGWGRGALGFGGWGWQLDWPHSSDGRGLRRSARQMPVFDLQACERLGRSNVGRC